MTDKSGLDGIWEDLMSYLGVDVHVSERATDGQCIVEFSVTNKAKTSPNTPDIVFEEVRLKFGVPPDLRTEKASNLGPGKSFTHQHLCRTSDLTRLKYSVEGRASPTVLLEIRGRENNIPATKSNLLSAAVYMGFFNELNAHKWLDTIGSLPAPGPETTLAGIQAIRERLGAATDEIRETKDELQKIFGFVRSENREGVLEHKRLVDKYLERTEEGCHRLSASLATPSTREFSSLKDALVSRLKTEAARLDEATDQLKKKYA